MSTVLAEFISSRLRQAIRTVTSGALKSYGQLVVLGYKVSGPSKEIRYIRDGVRAFAIQSIPTARRQDVVNLLCTCWPSCCWSCPFASSPLMLLPFIEFLLPFVLLYIATYLSAEHDATSTYCIFLVVGVSRHAHV